MAAIKIILVDDHEVVRSGLRMLLETQSNLQIIAEASSGLEAVETATRLLPDIVVIDINLPDISGIEATRRIKQAAPQVSVVALTIHEDEQFFFEALQAGASGYIPKRAAPQDLIQALQSVHRGEVYIYPALTRLLVSDFLNRTQEEKATKETMDGLTAREQEVLAALAQGKSNEDIAQELSISRHTVARHRENVMRKLELHSRSELVKYAIRRGLITP